MLNSNVFNRFCTTTRNLNLRNARLGSEPSFIRSSPQLHRNSFKTYSPESHNKRKLSLYVHWPYCKSICPYCDFNRYLMPTSKGTTAPSSYNNNTHTQSSEGSDHELHRSMRESLLKELETTIEAVKTDSRLIPGESPTFSQNQLSNNGKDTQKRNVEVLSIFFGGGTPSLAEPETLYRIIDYVKSTGIASRDLEVTMEANPTSIENSKLKHFRDAGVNRLSMGIQALNDSDLKKLGRNHSVEEALNCYELGRKHFDKVSFDLIYGRHELQTVEDWSQELRFALSLKPTHLSLYSLTFEPKTPFYRALKEGRIKAPSSDTQAELYEATVNLTTAAGLSQYEVSNFALPGHECLHNLNYWSLGDYIGIGPGAASRVTLGSSTRFSGMNLKAPEKWKRAVSEFSHGLAEFTELTPDQSIIELLLTGLRTRQGVSLAQMAKLAGLTTQTSFNDLKSYIDIPELNSMVSEGLLEFFDQGQRLRTTPEGLMVLDTVLSRIIV